MPKNKKYIMKEETKGFLKRLGIIGFIIAIMIIGYLLTGLIPGENSIGLRITIAILFDLAIFFGLCLIVLFGMFIIASIDWLITGDYDFQGNHFKKFGNWLENKKEEKEYLKAEKIKIKRRKNNRSYESVFKHSEKDINEAMVEVERLLKNKD